VGCNGSESVNTAGKLIYTDGGGSVNAIIFNSSEPDVLYLYKSKGISTISDLTKENNKEILFDECISGKCSIKKYSINTGQTKLLGSGRLPSYMLNHDKLFFYGELDGGDNWLFVASLENVNNATRISKEPGWKMDSSIRNTVFLLKPSGSLQHSD
jgi:hypothetical protein